MGAAYPRVGAPRARGHAGSRVLRRATTLRGRAGRRARRRGPAQQIAAAGLRRAAATFPLPSATPRLSGARPLPQRPRPTEPVGLYDPQLRARRLRRRVRRAARAASRATRRSSGRSRRSRTSSTAAPPAPTRTRATAPGSCCSCPTSSCAASSARSCRPPGAVRRRRLLPAAGRRAPRRARAAARATRSRPRASASSAGATSRSTRTTSASPPTGSRPTSSSSSSPPRPSSRADQDAFERKLYVIRRVAELAAGPDLVIPRFSSPHDRLQGDAHGAAAARLLPRPAGRADEDRARARPLALLDQHVPELGARAPVPR